MSVSWGLLLVAGAVVVAIAALLFVRRRAPEEGYFTDGDRASGVFGVLATGVAFLLGFVIFLSFESYDESRSGAETEALMVGQQVSTAQLMPPSVTDRLTGELLCYARSVVSHEWPAMEGGDAGNSVNPWGVALFRTLETARPGNAAEEAAYSKWLDQTSTREEGRLDRLHGAEGIIPGPVWLILFLSAGVIFVYMLFFADPSERPYVQAVLVGTVTAVLGLMFVVLALLDDPYHGGPGGLQPVAMERTLEIVDEALRAVDVTVPIPCDETGVAS
jgi:ABC-type branched-subunit amino acid transport system permease subunit